MHNQVKQHLPFLLLALTAAAAPVSVSWTLSPDDAGTNGYYTISYLPTNAASVNSQVTLTNVPGGTTNVIVAVPVSPCFVFGTFTDTNTGATSVLSTPCYFVAPVQPPRPPVRLQHL